MKNIYHYLYTMVIITTHTAIFGGYDKDNYHIETFDKAMIVHESQLPKYQTLSNNSYLKALRERYTDLFYNHMQMSDVPRIPLIIHQIWIGPAMPKVLQKFCQTWKKLNPHWAHMLWTENEINTLLEYYPAIKKYYQQETDVRSKANIARLAIVYEHGGVYIDTDFICLKPLDLLHKCCDFYTALLELQHIQAKPNLIRANNAVIGAAPKHPFLKICLEELKNVRSEKSRYRRTGMNFFSAMLQEHFLECPGINIVFPANYFYPWYKEKKEKKVLIQPETLAVHYYYSLNLHKLAQF